ncbi:hypothetical protein [Nonomuraea typhae]|uniref:Ricin B lectin domain-containing protein n=1 Tax=Nonomuraea typhae TaxID=2603600 RepID=A0ABW7YKQ0_9ACTN
MTRTERDLRELLEHDSLDGRHKGVSVAGVDRRVRRIRGRRLQTAGALAAAGLAIAVGAGLTPGVGAPGVGRTPGTAAPPGDRSTTSARPSPSPSELPVFSAPAVTRNFTRGGERRTVAFTTRRPQVAVRLTCQRNTYLLLWLNGRLVRDEPCGEPGYPAGWMFTGLPVKIGTNSLTAMLLKRDTLGGGRMSEAAADEAAAWATPFPQKWSLVVMEQVGKQECAERNVIVDPDSGREVLSWKCTTPADAIGASPKPS